MSQQTMEIVPLGRMAALPPDERAELERQARLLAWGGNAWHLIEFGIALFAGVAAGSIALIGFGADSLIEALAGFVVLWLFTGARVGSHSTERRAQQLIAASFFILAGYVGIEAIRSLAGGHVALLIGLPGQWLRETFRNAGEAEASSVHLRDRVARRRDAGRLSVVHRGRRDGH